MKKATRRMWARRVLRAGWLLAPILALPSTLWRCAKGLFTWFKYTFIIDHRDGSVSVGGIIGLAFITAILFLMSSCSYLAYLDNSIATPQEIQQDLAGNPCMIDLVPRRQEKGEPITLGLLYRAKSACNDMYAKQGILKQQQATLNLLKKK